MKVSIIIPVYNEEKTIAEIVKRVLNVKIPKIVKEVIVVDDGSTDKTPEILKELFKEIITTVRKSKNEGKGSAVIMGVKKATGDIIVIQDADLEYDPESIPALLVPIIKGEALVVYGTRLNRAPNLLGDEKKALFLIHYFGNRFLSLITSILYGQWLTDMETGYKIFPKKAAESMTLHSKGFEFEAEITAKLSKEGYRIKELPIKTKPRGYEQGKKLNTVKDGIKALTTLFRYRFTN